MDYKKLMLLTLFSLVIIPSLSYAVFTENISGTDYNFTDKVQFNVENLAGSDLNYVRARISLYNYNFEFNLMDNCNDVYVYDQNNNTAQYNIENCLIDGGLVYHFDLDIYIDNMTNGEIKNYTMLWNSDTFVNTDYLFTFDRENINETNLAFWISFNETNGNYIDRSTNGLTVTEFNLDAGTDYPQVGIINNSVYMQDDEYVRITSNAVFDQTNTDLSVSFYGKINEGDQDFLFHIGNGIGGDEFAMFTESGTFRFEINEIQYNSGVSTSSYLGEFHNYIIYKDGTTFRFYIDGTQEYTTSVTETIDFDTAHFLINARYGDFNSNPENFHDSYYDEFLLWTRAIDSDEINYLSLLGYNIEDEFNIIMTTFDEDGEPEPTETDVTFSVLIRENAENTSLTDLFLYENIENYQNDYAYVFICESVRENNDLKYVNYFYDLLDELTLLRQDPNGTCLSSQYINSTAEFEIPIDMIGKEADFYFVFGTFKTNDNGVPTIIDKKLFKKVGEITLNQGLEYSIILDPYDLYPKWRVFISKSYELFNIVMVVGAFFVGIYLFGSIVKGGAFAIFIGILLKMLGSGLSIVI